MADNERLLKNLYAAVEGAVFLGDRTATGQFGFLMQPGFFVSPNWTESDGSKDMATVYSLFNELVDTQCYYTPQPGTMSGWYSNMLEEVALPYQAPTPGEEREIKEINQYLRDNNPIYLHYRNQYFAAVSAFENEANSQFPRASELRRLAQLKTDRLSDWNSFGYKRQIENKRGRLGYLTRRDPSANWDRMRSEMADQERTSPQGVKYYQTFMSPPASEWANASWTQFTKDVKETDQYNYSKSVSWSGGASYGWGFFNRIGANASGEKRVEVERSETSNLSVNFKYLRVQIIRPWFDENIVTLNNWTWKKTFAGARYPRLSDGGNINGNPPQRPRGIMPVVVTDALLVKDVVLSADFSTYDRQMIYSRISGSASAGIGFFSIRGSYTEETREEQIKASFDGVSVKIKEPQCVAMYGKLLPLCPNPDPGLPWQGDERLPDPKQFDDEQELHRLSDYLQIYEDELKFEAAQRTMSDATLEYARVSRQIRSDIRKLDFAKRSNLRDVSEASTDSPSSVVENGEEPRQ